MRKRQIRLLCDADGVLLDFTSAATKVYEKITGTLPHEAVYNHWYFTDKLVFATQEQRSLFDKALKAPGFALSIPPFPEAQEAMKKLQSLLEVHIVTAPFSDSPTWTYERELSLALHFGINHNNVHHSQSKHVFSGDLFLDDKPANVKAWSDAHATGAAFLWDTPGNKEEKELERICSWDDFIERIQVRRVRA